MVGRFKRRWCHNRTGVPPTSRGLEVQESNKTFLKVLEAKETNDLGTESKETESCGAQETKTVSKQNKKNLNGSSPGDKSGDDFHEFIANSTARDYLSTCLLTRSSR
jgi:hypothetical protein